MIQIVNIRDVWRVAIEQRRKMRSCIEFDRWMAAKLYCDVDHVPILLECDTDQLVETMLESLVEVRRHGLSAVSHGA